MHTITRYHDISCGHRVVGHESKCRHLHGHNYRIHFTLTVNYLDQVGRVLDFSVVKEKLCQWLEDNWDHKFLAWKEDRLINQLSCVNFTKMDPELDEKNDAELQESIVWVPFNPTAENMAQHLVEVIGPELLKGTGCTLIFCTVDETRKCSASYQIEVLR